MARKETVREFINKRSSGAWVTFEFNVDKTSDAVFKQYCCISIEDFLAEYGRRSSYILDNYIVVNTKESYPSNDQGQTIWMTLQKKSEYAKTLKPIELTPFEVEDIIKKLENIKIKLNDYVSDYEAAEHDIDSIIRLLEAD